ncbi:MAG: hypothetical protein JHC33_11250 [Ignisphaera sp.]|nr:hypothetical protein [Ignisphaera sp.]
MTAIEWYFKQMQSKEHFTQDEFDSIYEQAKEMEKKDMLHFGAKCCIMTTQKNHWTLEKIYEETFNKNE